MLLCYQRNAVTQEDSLCRTTVPVAGPQLWQAVRLPYNLWTMRRLGRIGRAEARPSEVQALPFPPLERLRLARHFNEPRAVPGRVGASPLLRPLDHRAE